MWLGQAEETVIPSTSNLVRSSPRPCSMGMDPRAPFSRRLTPGVSASSSVAAAVGAWLLSPGSTRVSDADPSSGALTSTEVRVEAMWSEMLKARSRAAPTMRAGTISVANPGAVARSS